MARNLSSEKEHLIMQLMAEGFIPPALVAEAVESVCYNRLRCQTCGMSKRPEEFNVSTSMCYARRAFRQRFCHSCLAEKLAPVKVVNKDKFNRAVEFNYLELAADNGVDTSGVILPDFLWDDEDNGTELSLRPEGERSVKTKDAVPIKLSEPKEKIPPQKTQISEEEEEYDPDDFESDDEGIPDLPTEEEDD